MWAVLGCVPRVNFQPITATNSPETESTICQRCRISCVISKMAVNAIVIKDNLWNWVLEIGVRIVLFAAFL